MSRLWDKGEPLETTVARFTVGRDPVLDLELLPYDAVATMAHATMLAGIGILAREDLGPLRDELAVVVAECRAASFVIDAAEEDGHTALENRLTQRLGDVGRRIHTGRSRNDQVIAALRLWGREALLAVEEALLDRVADLLALATEHAAVALPGYTHSRQAMPSTLGFLFAAYAEGLLDDLPWLVTAFAHLDRSPLGSASGYGVALPLDRQQVSDLLAFAAPQENTLAVQNDRGKSEALILGTLLAPMAEVARLASDLIFLSREEIGAVGLDTTVTTGSSIMPQKRNPDALELLRASSARLRAYHGEVAALYSTLGAGYHRDLQLTKEPFLAGVAAVRDALRVLGPVLAGLSVDRARCRALVQRATAATDAAYAQVQAGTPFRTAYREVARDPAAAVVGDPADTWRQRKHLGAPGALDLATSRGRLVAAQEALATRKQRIARVWELLTDTSAAP